MRTDFDEQIWAAAVMAGVDPVLMQAIICQESQGDPFAHRVEPGYLKNTVVIREAEAWSRRWQGTPTSLTERTDRASSWGMSQIMGQVAREHGFDARYLTALGEVETNLAWMARLLAEWGQRAQSPRHLAAMWNGGKNIRWPLPEGHAVLVYVAKVQRYLGESPPIRTPT